MKLTEEVGTWASCFRRKVGAVIVRDNRVMATGYNGAPQGIRSCIERGECLREQMNIESGTHAELLDRDGFYRKLYNSQFAV